MFASRNRAPGWLPPSATQSIMPTGMEPPMRRAIEAPQMPNVPMTNADPGALGRLGDQIAGAQRPSFFGEGGTGRAILGTLGDTLQQFAGGHATYAPAMERQRREQLERTALMAQQRRHDTERMQDRQWRVEDRDAELNKPQYFMAGQDRVRFDPLTGESSVVYDAPEQYESYADALGLQPGDDGYQGAVQDYVLRGAGPTAAAGREALEAVRQGNRMSLRQTPTYAQSHPAPRRGGMAFRGIEPRSPGAVVAPIMARMAAGQPISASQQAALDYYKRPSARGARGGGMADSGGAPRISSQADYQRLPKGAAYTAPDGSRRVKP